MLSVNPTLKWSVGKSIISKDYNCGKNGNFSGNAELTLRHKGWGLNLSDGLTLSVQISKFDLPLTQAIYIVRSLSRKNKGVNIHSKY